MRFLIWQILAFFTSFAFVRVSFSIKNASIDILVIYLIPFSLNDSTKLFVIHRMMQFDLEFE